MLHSSTFLPLHVQATTDELTGLANRRLFEETLRVRVAEAARYGRPLSVLVLDLDNFKHVNDRYGHAGGDAVLVAIAQTVKDGVRASDLPARLAGDEFVAVLPDTTGTQALLLAAADGAAYAAKAAGKNNAHLATPTACHDAAIIPLRAAP